MLSRKKILEEVKQLHWFQWFLIGLLFLFIFLLCSCGKPSASPFELEQFFNDRLTLFQSCQYSITRQDDKILLYNGTNLTHEVFDITFEQEYYLNDYYDSFEIGYFKILKGEDRWVMVGNNYSCQELF